MKSTGPSRDTLLIDFDGTICATAEAVRFSLEAAFAEFRVRLPDPDRVTIAIGSGLSLGETIQDLHPDPNPSRKEMICLQRQYREAYSSEGYKCEVLFAGAEAALKECASRAQIVILSNKGQKAIQAAVERFGLQQYVREVMADRPGGPRKPDVRLFHAVQRRLPGVRRERSLVVGDTEPDLLFALAAGLRSCWAAYGYGRSTRCEAVGFDYVLERLEDLPRIFQRWSMQGDGGTSSRRI